MTDYERELIEGMKNMTPTTPTDRLALYELQENNQLLRRLIDRASTLAAIGSVIAGLLIDLVFLKK